MSTKHILIVEDDEDIRELVKFNLTREGWRVTEAESGEEAIRKAGAAVPDLVLLDLMLPGIDGLEVCRTLRAEPRTAGIPIVMLTAKSEESDVVAGLELGADDYLTKPFSPRVLVSHLRAVLRRRAREAVAADAVLKVHDLVIDPGRHEVRVRNKPVALSFTEFRVLQTLAARPGWVFTRQQIVDAVKGADYPVTDRSVDVQIVGIRKKLGPRADYIETVRGVGYRFKE